jgi:hypothetical protein
MVMLLCFEQFVNMGSKKPMFVEGMQRGMKTWLRILAEQVGLTVGGFTGIPNGCR